MKILRLPFLWLALNLLAGSALAAECPRIVSQSPYITQALDWLGLSDCIVGVSRYDRLPLMHTGGVIDPDALAIAELEPDLLIFSAWTGEAAVNRATPAGARALRVGGFRGMAEVESMLREIGRAAGVADIDSRVARFAAEWRAAASRIDGRQRRVLVLSACGDKPYSFGRGTTLFELFSAAGFAVVADHDSIRNFQPGTPDGDVAAWIGERRPELIFALHNSRAESCNPAITRPGVPILPLSGEYFTHPGPLLLDGLAELRQTLTQFDAP